MSAESREPVPNRLADYRPPPWLIDDIDLTLVFDANEVVVTARTRYRRAGNTGARPELRLDAVTRDIRRVEIDGKRVADAVIRREAERLVLEPATDLFELRVETRFDPRANQALEGLYRSGPAYCTQCEAEGFRKITPFPDRPDILTRYRVRIEADRATCPVLLANGNLVSSGDLPEGRHFAVWVDPFKKPCYLFALVAGDLGLVQDEFHTRSGRRVELRIYVDHGQEGKCAHAMAALKRAMAWDEQAFGREYDLDLFTIVAVSDFNFGAMENKGLNIFNSALVLADRETATDRDYQRIESVVAHEYFHNWSGNRVTLRDWFQLSLKEGFTVFREQSYVADTWSASVQRIEEVRFLRNVQFPEDGGPMSHPVRPESYVKIDNFYTPTVYEKGAEVIRMMRVLVGPEAFRRGTDLYFDRHDGQAVTCDDFVAAIEDAAGRKLDAFRLWYRQSGTPIVQARGTWNRAASTYELTLEQRTDPSLRQAEKAPLVIPVMLALLDREGRELPLHLAGETPTEGGAMTRVLVLDAALRRFVFTRIEEAPVPSLFRGFSAPVRIETAATDAELAFRLAHDRDGFNRWDAGQDLALRFLLADVRARCAGGSLPSSHALLEAIGRLLDDRGIDPSLLGELLVLPSEGWIGEQMPEVPVDEIHAARVSLRKAIATTHEGRFGEIFTRLSGEPFSLEPSAQGRRKIANIALAYLTMPDSARGATLAHAAYLRAGNMTDMMGALTCLVEVDDAARRLALEDFATRFANEPLVMNKWLALQAGCDLPDRLTEIRRLMTSPAYDAVNPNKVRALLGSFAGNRVHFHARDGSGYAFFAEQLAAIDARNPQLAARLAEPLIQWRRFDAARQRMMRGRLEELAAGKSISKNLGEVVGKSL